ncbi:MAG TPA: hypothetical protein VNK24_02610 [Elusimicrobiota bacterium]|nr:hypothetical protein [Elusimicrobiota bacterium]
MPVLPGASFQLHDSQSGEWTHLWFVISAPSGPDGDALCVNITTNDPFNDRTCVLVPGDGHPAIREDSVVAYGFAKILPTARLAAATPAFVMQYPANASILRKILAGAKNSKHLAPKFKKLL